MRTYENHDLKDQTSDRNKTWTDSGNEKHGKDVL